MVFLSVIAIWLLGFCVTSFILGLQGEDDDAFAMSSLWFILIFFLPYFLGKQIHEARRARPPVAAKPGTFQEVDQRGAK